MSSAFLDESNFLALSKWNICSLVYGTEGEACCCCSVLLETLSASGMCAAFFLHCSCGKYSAISGYKHVTFHKVLLCDI